MKPFRLLLLPMALMTATTTVGQVMEQVLVTATQEEAIHLELPLSASVISGDDLAIVSPVHVNQAFQRVPGAWISRGNGQESLTALRSPVLTGPGSCGAFFMGSDGVALRAPGFCNVNQLFDANTEQAARIEVLKGPSTALYGSGAMHGVINIITPRPAEELSHRVSFEGGPHDYRRGRYFISNTLGSHGFMLAANAASDGGYKRSSGFDQYKGSLRHVYSGERATVDSIFSATDLDQDTAGFITGYKAYKDSSLKKENPNPDAYRKAESQHFQSSIEWDTGTFSRIVVTPYWRHNDMEFLQHFFPWQPVEENGHESLGIKGRYYREDSWLKSVSGVDIESTDGWLKETQDDPFSPNQPQGVHYDYQVDALQAAAWTQLEWDLARQVNLSAGLRFEFTEYDYDNRTGDGPACEPSASACRFFRPADREDNFTNWSFNVAALWDFTPGNAAFLRVARGFRAPETSELYRLQGSQAEADLDSESLDSLELGVRGSYRELDYDIGLYYMEKDDVIFQDADRFNVSGASTLHYGLDFALRWQLTEAVDIAVDGTLAHHEYDSEIQLLGSSGDIEGNDIDTAPEHFGSLRLGWAFLPQYRAELEWVHMGEYYLEPDNRYKYDGHDLLNLRVTGRWRRLDIGIRATNITDEDYAERADFGFGSYRYFVGEPRSLFFELGYRLAP
jgi:outer membrane receptor protein involved in Fe transport